jgi:hypothetical protein
MYTRRYNIKTFCSRIATLLSLALLLLVAGHFTACEPEDWVLSVDCSDCYSFRPDSADLIIKLTINAENDSVPLTFYRGTSKTESSIGRIRPPRKNSISFRHLTRTIQ